MRRAAFLALFASTALAGCKSSPSHAPLDMAAALPDPARPIADAVLARRAMAYSGYRANEDPTAGTYPTPAEIKEDLLLLQRGHWTFIRLFDCSLHAQRVLQVIKDNALDFKVMQGVWISGPKAMFDQANHDEIERCVGLANTYKDIIVAVSVGNETLDDWSNVRVDPVELAAYITAVRKRIPQPVTTDDSYLPFTLGSDGTFSYASVIEVAKVVDFLSLHVYAFSDAPYDSWDWKQLAVPAGPQRAAAMMKAAMQYTEDSVQSVRDVMSQNGLQLPIVIGEAGWKALPSGTDSDTTEVYRAHPVNQKMFYDALESWVYGSTHDAMSPKAAFFFETFDEPWKTDDDGWGLFDTNRMARYALWSTFPDKKPPGAPPLSEADAVYFPDGVAADAGVDAF
jgi:exo-beta-1,3-glucanase (GH17 family)